MIVSCSNCGVKLKVDESRIKAGGSKLKCPKCANIFTVYPPNDAAPAGPAPVSAPSAPRPTPQPAPSPRPSGPKWQLNTRKVVVAHDGDSVLALTSSLLGEAGYEVITAREGVEAMIIIEREKPFLVIIDVALPRIFGFEICDRLKSSEESRDIKIILIASIYDKTRYKREPMSLYGASDYIEKHHIQDCLMDKVKRLASGGSAPAVREEEKVKVHPPEEMPVRRQQAEEMRRDEIPEFAASSSPTAPFRAAPPASSADPDQAEAARRFVRIILSDIALYNQGAVEEGIRSGNFREALAAELKEGRDLYSSRVPEEVRASIDYFDDEVEKFIEKKRNIMGL